MYESGGEDRAMSNYFTDVYIKRTTAMGKTKQQILEGEATQQFEENLMTSPNTETLSYNGESFLGIVLSNRQDAKRMTMQMHTRKNKELPVGAQIGWNNDDWIVLMSDIFSLHAYNKAIVARANVKMKFFTEHGNVIQTPGVFIGSLDSALREFYYRQMGLTVQLDERYAMLILPGHFIKANTRLMIDERLYRVVDSDRTTNRGLVYISLMEDNFDASRDSLEEGLADYYQIPKWGIEYPISHIYVEVGDTFTIEPVILKDGKATSVDFTILSDSAKISISEDTITGLSEGDGEIIVSLPHDVASLTIPFTIEEEAASTSEGYFIDGEEVLRWGQHKDYRLIFVDGGINTPVEAAWSISDSDLATVKRVNSVTYRVTANENNKSGAVTLMAGRNGETYEKALTIRSLW